MTLPEGLTAEHLLIAAAVFAALVLALLIWAIRAAAGAGRANAPLADGLARLAETAQRLGDGQNRLDGGLAQIAQAQGAAQAKLTESMERRLEEVQRRMGDTLHGSAARTARSLGELQQRLEAIDRAQGKIENLSRNVLSLQDILSNKQARGAFGEIQLHDLVTKALPPDSYVFQATLSNGKRADCLLRLPKPPGDMVIDAKFPLESYRALIESEDGRARQDAERAFRIALRKHVSDIADRYIVPGETAEGALMFLPSEAVYAELHARFPETVQEGFDKRVWIVSPTTMMASLATLRAVLKDARMAAEAQKIRRELRLLHADVGRLGERVGRLDQHFTQARGDLEQIVTSAEKISRRAARLETMDFPEAAEDERL